MQSNDIKHLQMPSQQQEKKVLVWTTVENLLQKQMFDEAFTMLIRAVSSSNIKEGDLNNESMMLIKALGKVGCKF